MCSISCREAFELGRVNHIILNEKIEQYLINHKIPFLKKIYTLKYISIEKNNFQIINQKILDDYLE